VAEQKDQCRLDCKTGDVKTPIGSFFEWLAFVLLAVINLDGSGGFGTSSNLHHNRHTMNSKADILLVGFGGSTPAPVSRATICNHM